MDTKIRITWPTTIMVLGLAAAAVTAAVLGAGEIAGVLGGLAGGIAVPSRARVGS